MVLRIRLPCIFFPNINGHRPSYIIQNNKGLPAARNYGIERSNGDYITCLDADDKFHADFFKTIGAGFR